MKKKAAKSFHEVEKYVAVIVGRFCRLYGLSFDEAWSAAGLGFAKAVKTYDGRRRFATWCGWKVEKELTEAVRQRACERHERTGYDLRPVQGRRFDAAALFWRLDADGIEAVMVVLDPPGWVKSLARKQGNTDGAFRRSVKEYLRASGWSDKRIWRTFRRVRRAL